MLTLHVGGVHGGDEVDCDVGVQGSWMSLRFSYASGGIGDGVMACDGGSIGR